MPNVIVAHLGPVVVDGQELQDRQSSIYTTSSGTYEVFRLDSESTRGTAMADFLLDNNVQHVITDGGRELHRWTNSPGGYIHEHALSSSIDSELIVETNPHENFELQRYSYDYQQYEEAFALSLADSSDQGYQSDVDEDLQIDQEGFLSEVPVAAEDVVFPEGARCPISLDDLNRENAVVLRNPANEELMVVVTRQTADHALLNGHPMNRSSLTAYDVLQLDSANSESAFEASRDREIGGISHEPYNQANIFSQHHNEAQQSQTYEQARDMFFDI